MTNKLDVETSEDDRLQNILTELILLALEDGVITKDELAVLQQIKLDMKSFREVIANAEEDGIITEEERILMDKFKKNVLKNAYDVTTLDHVITQEERVIISKLIKTLMNR